MRTSTVFRTQNQSHRTPDFRPHLSQRQPLPAATVGHRQAGPRAVLASAGLWIALAALTTLLLSWSALGQEGESGEHSMNADKNHGMAATLAVSGRGEVRTDPDVATVNLGVTAQAADAGEAQAEANRIAQAILDAVGKLGIEASAVQTSSLSLYPVYDNRRPREGQIEPQQPEIVGYRASNVVSVRLTDLEKIGPVIDATVGAGANEVQGVSFSLEDDAEARQQALTRAVKEARGKAETMAAALGRKLGPVMQVEEAGLSIERPEMARQEMSFRMAANDAASTPVSSGQIGVSAGVEVMYYLLP